MGKVTTVDCVWCGAKLVRPKKEVTRSLALGRRFFCNTECLVRERETIAPVGMSETQTRNRARKIWIKRHGGLPICRMCFSPADIHHKDGNPLNNEDSNHDPLCRSHHISLENHLHPKRKRAHRNSASAKHGQDLGSFPNTSTNLLAFIMRG